MNPNTALAILAFFADACVCRGAFRTMFRGEPSATPTVPGTPQVPGQRCDDTYGCPAKVGDTGLRVGGSYADIAHYVVPNTTDTTDTHRLITREAAAATDLSTAPASTETAEDVVVEAYRNTVYNDDGEVIYRPLPNPHDGGVLELWSQRNYHGHRTRLGRRPGVCDTVEAYVSSRVGFGRSARVLQEGVCCQLFTNRGCTGHSMMAAQDIPSLGPYGMDGRVKSARCNMCADLFKGSVEEAEPTETETATATEETETATATATTEAAEPEAAETPEAENTEA